MSKELLSYCFDVYIKYITATADKRDYQYGMWEAIQLFSHYTLSSTLDMKGVHKMIDAYYEEKPKDLKKWKEDYLNEN